LKTAEQPPNLLTSTLFIKVLCPDLYPEPTRKRRGYEPEIPNRLPIALSLAPNIKPKPSYDWLVSRKVVRAFDTLIGNRLPISSGITFTTRAPYLTNLYQAKPPQDNWQQGGSLALIFQAGDVPFNNVFWDGKIRKTRAALDPVGVNLSLAVPQEFALRAPHLESARKRVGGLVESQPTSAVLYSIPQARPFVPAVWPEGLIKKRIAIPDSINLAIKGGVVITYGMAIETNIALRPVSPVVTGTLSERYMWTKFIA
jgi:hypothetical protein